MNSRNRTSAPAATGERGLQRLQFELALDLSSRDRPLEETVTRAAHTSGADLVLLLPATPDESPIAVVRLTEQGNDSYLQVGTVDSGFAVTEQGQISEALIRLARSKVDVLRLIAADQSIRDPVALAS